MKEPQTNTAEVLRAEEEGTGKGFQRYTLL